MYSILSTKYPVQSAEYELEVRVPMPRGCGFRGGACFAAGGATVPFLWQFLVLRACPDRLQSANCGHSALRSIAVIHGKLFVQVALLWRIELAPSGSTINTQDSLQCCDVYCLYGRAHR
jgi:hypothetical protein